MKLINNNNVGVAIPTYRRKENDMAIMRLLLVGKVLGKKATPYTIDGRSGESYRLTISQNDDSEIGEEKVTEEVFKAVEKGLVYEFRGSKRPTRDKGDRVVFDKAKPITNNDKAIME